ncbi:hypothetical protein [Bradyrhizobium sp. UFLA05-112]
MLAFAGNAWAAAKCSSAAPAVKQAGAAARRRQKSADELFRRMDIAWRIAGGKIVGGDRIPQREQLLPQLERTTTIAAFTAFKPTGCNHSDEAGERRRRLYDGS